MFFAQIIRIVNEIWEKLKKHKFFKTILNLEKSLKTREIMYIVENMRFINDNVRTLKTFWIR